VNRPDKAASHSQPGTSNVGPSQGRRWRLWSPFIGIGVVVGVAIGVFLYISVGDLLLPASSQPDTATTGDSLGNAPGFSLPDQNGQTYTLTPGDGKNHLLVFYMGYF
jgi:hypothetical protein